MTIHILACIILGLYWLATGWIGAGCLYSKLLQTGTPQTHVTDFRVCLWLIPFGIFTLIMGVVLSDFAAYGCWGLKDDGEHRNGTSLF